MNLGYKTTHVGSSCGCSGSSGGSSCDPRKVKSVSRVGDNVIIAFDDCTYISAPFSVVDLTGFCKNTGDSAPTDNASSQSDNHEPLYSLGGIVVGEIKHSD